MNKKLVEALDIMQEECAEIIQAISKIRRFGANTHYPTETGPTNAEHLAEELGDLFCMIEIVSTEGLIQWPDIELACTRKLVKLKKWSTHIR